MLTYRWRTARSTDDNNSRRSADKSLRGVVVAGGSSIDRLVPRSLSFVCRMLIVFKTEHTLFHYTSNQTIHSERPHRRVRHEQMNVITTQRLSLSNRKKKQRPAASFRSRTHKITHTTSSPKRREAHGKNTAKPVMYRNQ